MENQQRARGRACRPHLLPTYMRQDGTARYFHDTTFGVQLYLLCQRERPNGYHLTHRGVAKALRMSMETLHRYQVGKTEPLKIVYQDMQELQEEKFFDDCFWDDVAEFRVQPVYRKMEDTNETELVCEITFNGIAFHTRKLRFSDNREFREVLWSYTDIYTPPVDRRDWEKIIDQASKGGYQGEDPVDSKELNCACRRPYDD